jgi:hypothetical protein
MAGPLSSFSLTPISNKRYNNYKVIPLRELAPCLTGIVAGNMYPVGSVATSCKRKIPKLITALPTKQVAKSTAKNTAKPFNRE